MQKKATTVLGRAVSTSVGSQNTVPAHQQNGAKNSLRDVILGGQDGLVNMLGIALGVIAGGGSNHILLVTGIAASITESISMGAVAYTSFGSDRDFYLAEKRREQTITSNREIWVSTMMDEELHLQPVEQESLLRSAVIVTVATLAGHLIPLVPFMVVTGTPAVIAAIAFSAMALFAVGVYSAKTLIGDWRKSGLQMVAIGLGAAALGFLIGRLFHSTAG